MMKKIKCSACGNRFAPTHPLQKYCSDACKLEGKREANRRFYRTNGAPGAAKQIGAGRDQNPHLYPPLMFPEYDAHEQMLWDYDYISGLITVLHHGQPDHVKAPYVAEREYMRAKILSALRNEARASVDPEPAQRDQPERQRAPSPNASEWASQVRGLRTAGVRTWQDICTHLGIDRGTGSARFAVKVWVRDNKPTWPPVPEPTR